VAESTRRPGMVGATCHFARDERGTAPRRDVARQGATRLPYQAPARLRVTRDGELELPHTTPESRHRRAGVEPGRTWRPPPGRTATGTISPTPPGGPTGTTGRATSARASLVALLRSSGSSGPGATGRPGRGDGAATERSEPCCSSRVGWSTWSGGAFPDRVVAFEMPSFPARRNPVRTLSPRPGWVRGRAHRRVPADRHDPDVLDGGAGPALIRHQRGRDGGRDSGRRPTDQGRQIRLAAALDPALTDAPHLHLRTRSWPRGAGHRATPRAWFRAASFRPLAGRGRRGVDV